MNPTTFNMQIHLTFSATPKVKREDKLSHSNNYACTKSIKTGCVKQYTHIRGSHTGKLCFTTHFVDIKFFIWGADFFFIT